MTSTGDPVRREPVRREPIRWEVAAVAGYMLSPFQGPAFGFDGSEVVIKASGQDTGGQLAVMEMVFPPGHSVHTHIHQGEDEMFLLLAGELAAFCGHEHWAVVPGCFVFVPRDVPHGFTVTGSAPARALVVTGPAQLDRHIAATGRPLSPA